MLKWTENELEKSIDYINNGFSYDEIAKFLKRTKKSVRLKLNKLGVFVKPKISTIEKECVHCNQKFVSFIRENRKYCSSSCSAKENNKLYVKRHKLEFKRVDIKLNDGLSIRKPKKELEEIKTLSIKSESKNCLNCNCVIEHNRKIYCTLDCFYKHNRKKYHNQIELGNTELPYRQYKNYLIEKYGNKCMECGWGEKNPTTNKIPIELEHIDGDSTNNNLSNLKLLCPNCHSLTPTYKGANKGNGRYSRKVRYKEGKSY